MENKGNSVGSSGNNYRVIKRSLSVRRLLPRRKAQAPGRSPPSTAGLPEITYSAANLSSLLNSSFFTCRFSTMASAQVCAVHHGRCICAGEYAAQGLKATNSSTPCTAGKEKRMVTGLAGKRVRCRAREQEGEDRIGTPGNLNVLWNPEK